MGPLNSRLGSGPSPSSQPRVNRRKPGLSPFICGSLPPTPQEMEDHPAESYNSRSIETRSSEKFSPERKEPCQEDEPDQDFASAAIPGAPSRQRDRRNRSLLPVDEVSISSDGLSGRTEEINNREARRNSRRLFRIAYSEQGSPTIVFASEDTDDLESHSWILDAPVFPCSIKLDPNLIPDIPLPTPPVVPPNTKRDEIEHVLNHCVVSTVQGGRRDYLVKWRDRSNSDSTWISEEELQRLAPDLLEFYRSADSTESNSSNPERIDGDIDPIPDAHVSRRSYMLADKQEEIVEDRFKMLFQMMIPMILNLMTNGALISVVIFSIIVYILQDYIPKM